jgi:hypothetical protein
MSRQDNSKPGISSSKSRDDLYEKIKSYWTDEIQSMLDAMVDGIDNIDDWLLTAQESEHLVKQVADKKGSIKSSFAFQIRKNLNDFKNMRRTRSHREMALGWRGTDSIAREGPEQNPELESIIKQYGDEYEETNESLFQKLQICVDRSGVEERENPVSVKNLCFSFRNSIDNLTLGTKYEAALYRFFASKMLSRLAVRYQNIDELLAKQGFSLDSESSSGPGGETDSSKNPIPREYKARNKSSKNLNSINPPALISIARSHEFLKLLHEYKINTQFASSQCNSIFTDLKKKLATLKITEIDKEVDHVSFLFNFVFSNKKLPNEIKTQLSRLQTFILMSAINDPGFLSRSSNPAHLLLDTVVKREIDLVESGRGEQTGMLSLKSGIDQLINSPAITSKSYAELLKNYQTNKGDLLKQIKDNRQKEKIGAEQMLKKSEEDRLIQIKIERRKKIEEEVRLKRIENERLKKSEEEKRMKLMEVERLQKKIKQQENLKKQKREAELKSRASQTAKIKRLVQSKVDEITIPLLALRKSFILFEKVWSPLLFQIALADGTKSPIWVKTLRMVRNQVWALIPKTTVEELQKLVATQSHISNSLMRGMRSLKLSNSLQKSLAEYLRLEHEEVVNQSKRKIKLIKNKASAEKASQLSRNKAAAGKTDDNELHIDDSDDTCITESKDKIINDIEEFAESMQTGVYQLSSEMMQALKSVIPGQKNDQPGATEADNIMKGDWAEMKQGSERIMAKLTWRSSDSSLYIFVDGNGNRVREIDGETLNSEIKSGLIKPVKSGSLESTSSFSVVKSPES